MSSEVERWLTGNAYIHIFINAPAENLVQYKCSPCEKFVFIIVISRGGEIAKDGHQQSEWGLPWWPSG